MTNPLVTSDGEPLTIGEMVVVDGLLKGKIVSSEGRCFTIETDDGRLEEIQPWWIVSKWKPCDCLKGSPRA